MSLKVTTYAHMERLVIAVALAGSLLAEAWAPTTGLQQSLSRRPAGGRARLFAEVVSPFADSASDESEGENLTNPLPEFKSSTPLELTLDNVEMILDEMRPYLISVIPNPSM